MVKVQLTSILNEVATKIFSIKNLDESKLIFLNCINKHNINEVDKNKMLREVNNFTSKYQLDKYIANSLLKYEGLGVNQINKTAREAAAETEYN